MRRRPLTGGVLAVWLATAAWPGLPIPAHAAEPGADCAACHEELVRDFPRSAHGLTFASDRDHSDASCASCHGPGEKHVESGGDIALIENPRKQSGEEADHSCLACHDAQRGRAYWHGSAHEEAGVSCAACHDLHGSGTAAAGTGRNRVASEKCLSCHTNHRKDLFARSSHPLRDGAMECASCHDPHGADGEHLVRAAAVNDLCFSCHQEKRGPFLWEHSPVREDCLTCHTPHSSNHDKMLVARPAQLCQSCHLQGRHQTVAGFDASMWNTNRQCLNCHPQIHGSNHPSGPLFQR